MDIKEQQELVKDVQKRVKQKKFLFVHLILFITGSMLFFVMNKVLNIGNSISKDWFLFVVVGWFFIWAIHFINVYFTKKFFGKNWEKKQIAKLITKHNNRVLKLEKKLIKEGIITSEEKQRKSLFGKSKNKQIITIIAAVADSNALGKDNKLIWHLPADLKRFKSLTSGHYIIMGRKTYESIGKPLPNRTTVIITRKENYSAHVDCIVVNSMEDALDAARNDDNPFIIGGAQIYELALPLATKLDITHVHHNFDADAYFPAIDTSIWEEVSREDFPADEKNKYDYSFVTYIRK